MDEIGLPDGRLLVGRHGVQALYDCGFARAGIREPRRQARDRDAAGDGAVIIEMTQQGLGYVTTRRRHQFDSGKLDRLILVHPAGQTVTNANLDRRGHRPNSEGDHKPEVVIAVPPPSQHSHGIHRSDQEAAHQVGRDDHMCRLPWHRIVEDHLDWVDLDHVSVGIQLEARRCVHPGVGGNH